MPTYTAAYWSPSNDSEAELRELNFVAHDIDNAHAVAAELVGQLPDMPEVDRDERVYWVRLSVASSSP